MSDATIVSEQDGTYIYRASALYSCQNALLLARLGYDGTGWPEWMEGRASIGHTWEPIILEELRTRAQMKPFGFQDELDMRVGSTAMIRGHVDGLHPPGEPFMISRRNGDGRTETPLMPIEPQDLVVIDAKALAGDGYENWIKKAWDSAPYYAWQMAYYCDVLDAAGCVMAVKNKVDDRLLIDYWDRESIPVTKADYFRKVLAVEKLAEDGEDAIFRHPCAPRMFPCPYYFMHPANERVEVKDGEVTGDLDVIGELGQLHIAAAAAEKEAKAEKERVEQQIRERYGNKAASAKLPDATVTTYHHTYSAPDWDAIAEACELPDADAAKEKFLQAQTSEKLSVKVTPKRKKS